jgi:predicted lipoprotein with Yx(FWY)xxD motif
MVLVSSGACERRGNNETGAVDNAPPNITDTTGRIGSAEDGSSRTDTPSTGPTTGQTNPGVGQAGVAAGLSNPQVTLIRSGKDAGAYLTDSRGRTVYALEESGGSPVVQCTGQCATLFEPVIGSVNTSSGDSTVRAAMIGQVTLPNGQRQISFNGRPLYYLRGSAGARPDTGRVSAGNIRARRINPGGSLVSERAP